MDHAKMEIDNKTTLDKSKTLSQIIDDLGVKVSRSESFRIGKLLSSFNVGKLGKTKEEINGKQYKVRLYDSKYIKLIEYVVKHEVDRRNRAVEKYFNSNWEYMEYYLESVGDINEDDEAIAYNWLLHERYKSIDYS